MKLETIIVNIGVCRVSRRIFSTFKYEKYV